MERIYRELLELKGLLRASKYSYKKIAQSIGIHTTTFSDKINGYSTFTLSEADKIIKLLNISVEEISKYFF